MAKRTKLNNDCFVINLTSNLINLNSAECNIPTMDILKQCVSNHVLDKGCFINSIKVSLIIKVNPTFIIFSNFRESLM